MPPSLTPFFDIRGWVQDTIDKAVQPLVEEISMLKERVSRLEDEVKHLKLEPSTGARAGGGASGG